MEWLEGVLSREWLSLHERGKSERPKVGQALNRLAQ
jgi:hypothetical protein